MHINATTFVANFIHSGISGGEIRAWYSVCYYFTVRPLLQAVGQMVVQMRVLEISLESGIQVQNKRNLCP